MLAGCLALGNDGVANLTWRCGTMIMTEKNERLTFPWDLSEWISRRDLLDWVEAEVSVLDWQHPDLIDYLKAHPDFQPRKLLSLLLFAYATGVFDSEDVINLAYGDPEARARWGVCQPTIRDIRLFRRENRSLLQEMLTALLKRVLHQKFALGSLLLPAGLRRFLSDSAVQRLDLARHMDRANQGA